MRSVWPLALLVVACDHGGAPAPRWFIAKQDVAASDDASIRLRRGFGIEGAEQRGDALRTSLGHWFPRAAFEPASAKIDPAPAAPAAPPARPPELGAAEPWIDVDIAAQVLTLYRGDQPQRAMRISTGVGAEGASYSTPRGVYRIYAKLRSATMASAPPGPDAPPDPHAYRFEAVPHVQYFFREIALHGAYWHRRFGERISHGCVNLAPADAAWLFERTDPPLQARERERRSAPGKLGTLVRVR